MLTHLQVLGLIPAPLTSNKPKTSSWSVHLRYTEHLSVFQLIINKLWLCCFDCVSRLSLTLVSSLGNTLASKKVYFYPFSFSALLNSIHDVLFQTWVVIHWFHQGASCHVHYTCVFSKDHLYYRGFFVL